MDPSHVGVTFNQAVDDIVKGATRKHEVDIQCMRTLKQAKSNIKRTQTMTRPGRAKRLGKAIL